MDGVEQVYCFENRGEEIGVTLHHPHGQIYAFPFVTPRTRQMVGAGTGLRGAGRPEPVRRSGRCRAGGRARGWWRANDHWTAFVPAAARWPYEVLIFPARRVPDLALLADAARAAFCDLIYLDVLRRFDRLFGTPGAIHRGVAPGPGHRRRGARGEFGLHLQVFTVRRAPGKLKYLAGTESGMGVWVNDIVPETAARRLREA